MTDMVHNFAHSAISGMEERYRKAIMEGKTDIAMEPITMRIGPDGIENIRELHNITNVQELKEATGVGFRTADLDALMPDDRAPFDDGFDEDELEHAVEDAEAMRRDPDWRPLLEREVKHVGWKNYYAKKRQEKGEAHADKKIEDNILLNVENRPVEWKRERLKKISKYHAELKDKKPEDIDQLPAEHLDRYVSVADARRIKYMDDKRLLLERQSVMREAEGKRIAAETKKKRTKNVVSDATMKRLGEWNEKEHPGWARSLGNGLKATGEFALRAMPPVIAGIIGMQTIPAVVERIGASAEQAKAQADITMGQANITRAEANITNTKAGAAEFEFSKLKTREMERQEKQSSFFYNALVPGALGGIFTGGVMKALAISNPILATIIGTLTLAASTTIGRAGMKYFIDKF
jgi:hypothetical protein